MEFIPTLRSVDPQGWLHHFNRGDGLRNRSLNGRGNSNPIMLGVWDQGFLNQVPELAADSFHIVVPCLPLYMRVSKNIRGT